MSSLDDPVERLKTQAQLWTRGNRFEDFEMGQSFLHHWGRTLTRTDNTTFSALTLHYGPAYINRPYAEAIGHRDSPINPLLVFNTVLGLSVEDLSEQGGPFLGVEELAYVASVYPGDTVYARSEVIAKRLASNRPGYGIVTWHTQGINQHDEVVVDFKRANLVRTRT